MPCSGLTTYGAVTPALPPPADMGLVVPSAPMTAIEEVPEPSGSVPPSFFSRTVPCSAAVRARSACAWSVTTVFELPVGGWLKNPKRNISVRIRLTMPFSVAMDTWPSSTAACSAGP